MINIEQKEMSNSINLKDPDHESSKDFNRGISRLSYLLSCGQISVKLEFQRIISKSLSVGNRIDSWTEDLVTGSSTSIDKNEQQW